MTDTRAILGKIRHLELRTKHLVEATFSGQYHSIFKGRGMNFEEVRQYQPGDEIRSIDWNVTARTGEAYVKKFTEERDLTVMLVVDLSASGAFGSREMSKRELAAEVAAILAFCAIRNNDRAGLLLFTSEVELFVPPRKGRQHVLRLVREMLFHEPRKTGTDLTSALDYVNKVMSRRAVVFLISDFQAKDYRKAFLTTHQRHDLVALSIIDPAEQALPPVGRFVIEDSETGEQYEIDLHNPRLRERFEKASSLRSDQLHQFFLRNGVDHIELQTDRDYLPSLRTFFKNRMRRLARG